LYIKVAEDLMESGVEDHTFEPINVRVNSRQKRLLGVDSLVDSE